MSTRYNNGSHYENHQRAAELHDLAAHSHRVGEQQGKQDHLTAHEHSRQALEHANEPPLHARAAKTGHSLTAVSYEDIAARAYQLWQAKGRPAGSAQEDWLRAVEELRSEARGD